MNKHFILSCLCFFSVHCVLAQAPLPLVYEIKSDTAYQQILDTTYYQVLEDKESKWTINDVSRFPLSAKFHTKGIKEGGIDTNDIHTYWQRYRLKNTMVAEAKVSVWSQADYVDLFIKKGDSSWIQYRSGNLQGWDKKNGLKSPGAILLALLPGEEMMVYDRRSSKKNTNFETPVALFSTEKIIQQEYVDYVDSHTNYFGKMELQEAFMLGLIFLAIFLNLFFFRIVREKAVPSILLYLPCFWVSTGYGILRRGIFSWAHPAWVKYLPYLGYAWAFIPYFLIQFYRQFFKTAERYPIWDKWLEGVGILNIIAHVVKFISQIYFNKSAFSHISVISTATVMSVVIPLSIVITLLLFLRRPTNQSVLKSLVHSL